MAVGDTYVSSVEDGLNTMVAAARIRQQFPQDIMPKLADTVSLAPGQGTKWREVVAENLTSQSYSETEEIENPQEIQLSVLEVTPQLTAIHVFIGKRVQLTLDKKVFALFGQLAQNANQVKKDKDGLALFSTATTTLCGTGTNLTAGHVMAAVSRIVANSTEPGTPPYACVLHRYGLHSIEKQVLSGLGTYPIPTGMSEQTFKEGYRGMIAEANVFVDGLITIDSTPDARGGVFAKRAILLVQGASPWIETRDEPQKGYGGVSTWTKDEYYYAERSPGNWLYGLLYDATAPTS